MLWALAITPALAVDLTTLLPAWTVLEADDDDGAARAVFFEPSGEVTAAGWVGGTNDHDAYVLQIALDGTATPLRLDDAGEPGVDGLGSDDRWYDALRDDAGRLVLCGQRGDTAPIDHSWYALTLQSDDVTVAWSAPYDGGNASPEQACHGIDRSAERLHTAGWAWGNDTFVGRWHLWALNPTTGLVTQQSLVDLSVDPARPDTAWDVQAYDDATTAVVGDRSGDGRGVGRIERRDGATVMWQFEHAEGDTTFTRVAVDRASGRTVVVGTEVADDGSSDGLVYGFNQSSFDLDQPPLWSLRWDEADDSGITGVTLDDTGAFLVLGWVVDAGVERWRVVRYTANDGSELDRWEGPAWSGDSRPYAAAFDGTHLAVAGTIDDGTGPRFAVTLLGPDRDGDDTPDIVDLCPDDVGKIEPGVCGCDIPDSDVDGDGALGCEEACPSDPFKLEPGVCGCNMPDEDDDGDGVLDCDDGCEDDPGKTEAGVCGCGVPDSDDDGDGLLVCQDQCPDTLPGVPVDAVGCEIVETVDTAAPDDTGAASEPSDDKGGCGCQATGGALGFMPWGLALWALRRRRSAAAPAC